MPTRRDESGSQTRGHYGQKTYYKGKESVTRGSYSESTLSVEEWTYDCGYEGRRGFLVFQGTRLIEIRVAVGGPGRGESDCIGVEARENNGRKKSEENEIGHGREIHRIGSVGITSPSIPSGQDGAEKKGTILLSGDLDGANVYLDGDQVGTMPCTLYEIRPGMHRLEIKKEGYKVWKKLIRVKAGETIEDYVDLKEKDD